MSQGEQTDENSSGNSAATPMESEHHLADASLHKEIAIHPLSKFISKSMIFQHDS